VARVPFEQQQRGMQQISRTNFSVPNRSGISAPVGNPSGGGFSSPATHGWGRFGEPIHSSQSGTASPGVSPQGQAVQRGPAASGGWGRVENSRPSAPPNNNFAPGQRSFAGNSGEAVHISPPMVQQRSAPNYQAPNYQRPIRRREITPRRLIRLPGIPVEAVVAADVPLPASMAVEAAETTVVAAVVEATVVAVAGTAAAVIANV
jgi:hypothetical protein